MNILSQFQLLNFYFLGAEFVPLNAKQENFFFFFTDFDKIFKWFLKVLLFFLKHVKPIPLLKIF